MANTKQLEAMINDLKTRVDTLTAGFGCLASCNQAGAGSWNSTGSWQDFSDSNWPYLDFTVPPSGKVMVVQAFNGTTTPGNWMSCGFRITGTDSVSASYRNAIRHGGGGYGTCKASLLSLTPGGSDTLIPQWRCDSGTSPTGDDGTGRIAIYAA